MDRGVWWVTVHGVIESDMMERLNSSNSRTSFGLNLLEWSLCPVCIIVNARRATIFIRT